MGRRFLRSLRTKQAPPPAGPGGADQELKVVLADYYNSLTTTGSWGPTRVRPWPIERAVTEGYERIVWVYKSVEAISTAFARLPYRVKDGEEELDEHPLYRVLNRRANPMETGREFRKRLCSQVLLSKAGAFVETTASRGGEIVRMDLLPPGRTRPVPGRYGELIDHYEVTRADGTIRNIEPDRVRWFREPHPLDPYSGVTPLEAAGMSAELDFFARLYNISFLKNDARPGGVLAVNGEMDPTEMDRIEDRFKKGPTEAGNLTVVNGEVSYVDLAARPREMQYETVAKTAKNEVLCAFGVPESVLGYAADRSYSNAEQEQLNFWQVTMPPWLDLFASTLDGDSEDDLVGFFGTDDIEVLQRAKTNRREEARKEFELGLISPNEYREAAGYEEIDMPKTRSLFIPSGKQVVPTSEGDTKKIDKEAMDKLPAEFIANAANPAAATAPGRPGAQPVQAPRPLPNQPQKPVRAVGQPRGAAGVAGGRAPARAAGQKSTEPPPVTPARPSAPLPAARPVMRLHRPRDRKMAGVGASHGSDSDGDERVRDRLESELGTALTALGERWLARTVARLESPKSRKGTRHWTPDPALPSDTRIGNKALDAPRAVDGERWGVEAEETAKPLITAAATAAAAALVADLASDTAAAGAEAARRTGAFAGEMVRFVGGAVRRAAGRLTALINDADQRGASLVEIAEMVQGEAEYVLATLSGIAVQAATGTVSGAREGAAQAVADTDVLADVRREWRTRRDDKVRDSHRKASGQVQPVGSPFVVGGALLRFPGDPFGPPGEVRECRCRLTYRSLRSGRFVAAPASEWAAG